MDYNLISSERLEKICDNGHFKEFNYIFDSAHRVSIFQWFDEDEEFRQAINNCLGSVRMNSIYFSDEQDENSLYVAVIPRGCHVNIKTLGRCWGFSGKESKRRIYLASNYSRGQSPGNLSPFISTMEEKDVKVCHAHSYDIRQLEHSYPGRSDISLMMSMNQNIRILQKRFSKDHLKFVSLSDILKKGSLEKLNLHGFQDLPFIHEKN